MPFKMQIVMVLTVAGIVGIAVAWIKADLDEWGNTVIVFDDDELQRVAVIKPGDTIWHIARREYGGSETGKWVYQICELNPGLDPGKLQVGQVVQLP